MISDEMCSLEVKLLNSEIVLLERIPLDETVKQLYDRIGKVETAAKWKLMIITSSPRTLKLNEEDSSTKRLRDYGVEAGQQYRLEVVLASFNLF